MTESDLFPILLVFSFSLCLVVFVSLFLVSAPYGRYARQGWGPQIPNRAAWLVMESFSPVVMVLLFFIGNIKTATTVVFLLMWLGHYVYRAFIYPFQLRDGKKKMPVVVMLMAIGFNLGNSYINGRYLFSLAGEARYPAQWLLDPSFMIGVCIFIAGFIINLRADQVLRQLRSPGELGYRIPQGGLFRYISCPNYFGEIIEWSGWAIATWSLPGLAFAAWTFANLAPRARAHNRWYRDKFPEYPKARKALIPGVW